MPIKIGFTVVSSTGEDERYRATDLNYHGPTVKGWRSSQFCTYPQEITLQLNSNTVVHRIQILAHQYLIPQKIEIWTCEDVDYDPALSPNGTQLFKYLGFITLSDNQATGFKSRELKSVTTPPTLSRFIRLRLHANHSNDKNLFNQVGLVAVSVLGEPLPQEDVYGDEVNNNGQYDSLQSCGATLISNPQYTSPYDDLAFEMYVDSDVARIMRLMEAKKHQAVLEERFEYARKLKLTLEELREVGETLGRLEQEKKQAINLEDYDKAKAKKQQIESYRDKIYASLNVEQLLELDGPCDENDCNSTLLSRVNKKEPDPEPEPEAAELEEEPIISPPPRLEVDTRSPHHPRYIPPESPQFSEPIVTWSPHRPRRRTSFSEIHRSISPNQLSHSFSHSSFPVSSSSHHIRSITPQFQCYTPYSYQPSLNICNQTSSTDLYHSLPPIRPQEPFHSTPEKSIEPVQIVQSKIPVVERNKSPTNSNTSNMSRSPTNMTTRPTYLRGSLRKRNKSNGGQSKSSYEAYEERMLPALRHPHFHGTDVVRECQITVDQSRKSKLNERERKQAALPISVYGIELVEKFYSKHFADKEEGLRLLQEQLKLYMKGISEEETASNPPAQLYSANKMARAAIFLMHRALRDKVYSVYSAAADAVRFFFMEFLPGRLSPAEVARSVEKLVPELLSKAGDVTPRIHNMAAHTLLSMADCREVRELHIIPVQLSRPLSSSVHPRLALSRLEMVEQLILNHGISTEKQSGLTCRTLAEFGASGLHHPAEAVRKVSERILLHVYQVNPRLVRKQLPPDDDVTRRNLLYRHLFQEFDLMDTQKREQRAQESLSETVKSSTLPKPTKLKLQDQKQVNENLSDITDLSSQEIVKSKSDHAVHTMASQIPKRTVNQQTSPMKPFMPTGFSRDENENKVSNVPVRSLMYGNCPNQNENGLQNGNVEKPTLVQAVQRATTLAEKADIMLKRRSMTRISEEVIDIEGVKEKTAIDTIAQFPNLVDSIHVAESRSVRKSLKYIFPTSYIGNSTTSQETVNKANSTTTFCKINPELTIGKSHTFPTPVSGIPIPKNGFNGKGGGFFNSLLFTKKFANKFNGKKDETENSTAKEKDLITQTDLAAAIYYPSNDSMNNQAPRELLEQAAEENTSPASILTPPSEGESPALEEAKEKEGKTYKTCIFCFAKEDWFTEESLNIHYWKNCPMLTRCTYCQEVVEVSGLIQHRLDDCDQKGNFRECSSCKEAILKEDYENHICRESNAVSARTRCTLCHSDLDKEEDWREHLMGEKLCPNHPRKSEQS